MCEPDLGLPILALKRPLLPPPNRPVLDNSDIPFRLKCGVIQSQGPVTITNLAHSLLYRPGGEAQREQLIPLNMAEIHRASRNGIGLTFWLFPDNTWCKLNNSITPFPGLSILVTQTLLRACISALALLCLSACAALVTPNYTRTVVELRPGQYQLDTDHAYVHFKIEHLGLSTIVGRFNKADASLDFDPQALAELKLEGFVDVEAIDLNNRDLEKRLRGRDWFYTERFPQASFSTNTVTPGVDGNFIIEGNFTLRGISKPLVLDARFKGGADNLLTGKYTLGFAATGSFLRSDFGIDGLGGLVADEVFIEINAEFQKSDG